MNLRLSVTPNCDFPGVASTIEKLNGLRFSSNDDWCDNGTIKWPTLTEDMKRLSKSLKNVEITLTYDGEDDSEGAEHFFEGRTYAEIRPNWSPSFPSDKLLK